VREEGLTIEKLIFLIPFIFGVMLFAFGLFFARLGLTMRASDSRIAAEGVDGEAVIKNQRTVHTDLRNGGGRDEYYITLEFTPNSPGEQTQKVSQETQVSTEDYQHIGPGDKIAIRYLPKQPKELILLSGLHEQGIPFFMNAGIAAMVVGAALLIFGIVIWVR
jgi:hypothetical protein